MTSVQAAVDVMGLDPKSTTANASTKKFNPSKVAEQVLIYLTIILFYFAILHDITSFPTRILGMLISVKCLFEPAASFKQDSQIRVHKYEGKIHHHDTISR